MTWLAPAGGVAGRRWLSSLERAEVGAMGRRVSAWDACGRSIPS